MRIEKDFLGEKKIEKDALYGIHSLRAQENFPDSTTFPIEWFKAMALVKRACYLTADAFYRKGNEQFQLKNTSLRIIGSEILDLLAECALECEKGLYFDQFIVPAVSGGAGTSINMNVNEIIANLALVRMGHAPGSYEIIDPIEHANIFQSTNDVVPTALKITVMQLFISLEESINAVRLQTENMEKEHRYTLRIGYTQMQEAVPSTFGQLFSTYSDALSRDWWRVSKCLERIKVVNIGGSAIGSSVTVPKYFVNEIVRTLQQLSGLPVTRGENLYDATNNLDAFVEVHGIIKAHAVNLEKMVNDLRLLSSDLTAFKDIEIPGKQAGSSIMPGKVNPVIPEFVISCVHRVYSNDILISSLSAQGCLELNAYLPVIGCSIIESLKLLIASDKAISNHLINGLKINKEISTEKLFRSPVLSTMLLPYIGYHKATDLSNYMKNNNKDIFEANYALQLMEENKLREILKPENIIHGGFSLKDIAEQKKTEL